jgi:hypothetical protein
MKRFNKTYRTEGLRVRIQISDTSDRLTIYEVRDNCLGRRIKYEWYFKRKTLISDMVKDLTDVNVPTTTICEVVDDIQMNLIFLGLYKN